MCSISTIEIINTKVMSWKSTIEIKRDDAIKSIIKTLDNISFDELSNEQLKEFMYMLNIGDDVNKPYYGHNFIINN